MRVIGSVAIAAVLGTAAPASATITERIGGPGGTDFELRCPEGSIAVGARAHAGAWIDGLMLLCSDGRRGREATQSVGSTHSSVQESYCPRGDAVRSLWFTFTNGQGLEREYLNSLIMSCTSGREACIETGDGCDEIADKGSAFDAPDPRFRDFISCPEDEVLVGVAGRAGKHVDAIGAICGPGLGAVRSADGERQAPRPAYQDMGEQQVGDGPSMNAPVQALPSSPNPDVNASPTLPPPSIPVTESVTQGMQRNTPPPIEQPR